MLELNAAVTVDLVVLTVRRGELLVLLVRRGISPFAGRWALPGGFVLPAEDLSTAAARELAEETGIESITGHLEQLGTYGAPRRDPRGRVVTVAYLALVPDLPAPTAGTDAASARWAAVAALEAESGGSAAKAQAKAKTTAGSARPAPGRVLAFDHDRILADGVERARAKLEYSPVAAAFCPPEFTIAELRRVYEAVWGHRLDPRNFHRKVTGSQGFLAPVGAATTRDGGRPAQLYRTGPAQVLYPPMLRA